MIDYEAIKRTLNRSFAVISPKGKIWMESNSLERCRDLQSELLAQDGVKTKVIGRTYTADKILEF